MLRIKVAIPHTYQTNRLSSTINGQTTTYSYNNDDELISKTTSNTQTSYSYNQDGQLTSKGTTQYSYDTFGNLKEVILPNNTKITYMYNANNQRTAKLINNQIEEKYLWLNLTTLLAVYDKDDNIKQRFTYIDERTPISYTDKNNNIYYLSYNHQGTLKAITNENNQILKELEYDSFGNIINETYFDINGNIITSNPNLDIPFTFAGGLYDKDTKLIKFGYRDYDSSIGRWITKDPIDFEGGDSNLYGYVLGDPVNLVDPSGLVDENHIDEWNSLGDFLLHNYGNTINKQDVYTVLKHGYGDGKSDFNNAEQIQSIANRAKNSGKKRIDLYICSSANNNDAQDLANLSGLPVRATDGDVGLIPFVGPYIMPWRDWTTFEPQKK